jgi:hypothetical protein
LIQQYGTFLMASLTLTDCPCRQLGCKTCIERFGISFSRIRCTQREMINHARFKWMATGLQVHEYSGLGSEGGRERDCPSKAGTKISVSTGAQTIPQRSQKQDPLFPSCCLLVLARRICFIACMAMASLSLSQSRERVPTAALDHALLQIVVRDKAAGLAFWTHFLGLHLPCDCVCSLRCAGVPQTFILRQNTGIEVWQI